MDAPSDTSDPLPGGAGHYILYAYNLLRSKKQPALIVALAPRKVDTAQPPAPPIPGEDVHVTDGVGPGGDWVALCQL